MTLSSSLPRCILFLSTNNICIKIFIYFLVQGKGKATPIQARTGPEASRNLRLPDFKTIGTRILYGFWPLRIGSLWPGSHLCFRRRLSQVHIAAGSIMSIKEFSDTIGNRSPDLPACNAVLELTVPPRGLLYFTEKFIWLLHCLWRQIKMF
jgi:hypothetical protein